MLTRRDFFELTNALDNNLSNQLRNQTCTEIISTSTNVLAEQVCVQVQILYFSFVSISYLEWLGSDDAPSHMLQARHITRRQMTKNQ